MSVGRKAFLFAILPLAGLGVAGLVVFWPSSPDELGAIKSLLARREFRLASEGLERYLNQFPEDLEARLLAIQAARRGEDLPLAARHLEVFARSSPGLTLELEQRLMSVQAGDLQQGALVYDFCTAHPEAPESIPALESLILADFRRCELPLNSSDAFFADKPPAELARLQKSVDLWLELCDSSDDRGQGLVWKGRLNRIAGNHAAAIAAFEQAIQINPHSFDARLRLAHELSQSNPLESMRLMESLLAEFPGDDRLRMNLAAGHRTLGNTERAVELLDEILREQPKNAAALVERAAAAMDENKLDEAKGFLERAMTVAPDFPELHLGFSRYMTLTEQPTAAKHYQLSFQSLDAKRRAAQGFDSQEP